MNFTVNRPAAIGLALLFMLLCFTRPALAADTVRVLVMEDVDKIALQIPSGYSVEDKTGEGVFQPEGGSEGGIGAGAGGGNITMDSSDSSMEGIKVNAGSLVININEFALTGVVEIRRNARGLFSIINELGIEEYIRAVVGEEMSPGWPIEALKAQAVVTRTYTLFRKARSGKADYDLCATVNSQVFTGGAKEKEGPARAAMETEGEVLTHDGRLVEALYHSSCGGTTEDSKDVWDRKVDCLKSQDCSCGSQSPYRSWEKALSADDIEKAMNDGGHKVSGITSIKVIKKTRSGRASLVWVESEGTEITLKGNEFRRVVGYSKLPSTYFTVKKSGGSFMFTGKGSGHGVGLCQWGAKVMADDGKDYREILGHYYPGAKVERPGTEEGR